MRGMKVFLSRKNRANPKNIVIGLIYLFFLSSLILLTGWMKTAAIVLDLIVFCGFFALICNRKISWLFVLPLSLIIAQVSSLAMTGAYIVPLTIMNLNEYSSVGWSTLLKSGGIFLSLFALGVVSLIQIPKFIKSKAKVALYILSLIIWVSFFECSPIANFVTCMGEVYKQMSYGGDAVKKYKVQQTYFKNYIYSPQRVSKDNLELLNNFNLAGKNVIVFFIEGFNYNNLSYVNKFQNLTPNIDKLLSSSLSFSNYYNHTAATFRGLRGQLTSSYQYLGGYRKDLIGIGQISQQELEKKYKNTVYSIPNIIKKHGYESYFINPHSEQSNISIMLRTMGFDKVYGCEKSQSCDKSKPIDARIISDKLLFANIKQVVSELENKAKSKTDESHFFIGVYNIGTHLGMDSPDEKYEINDVILNSVHNFDHQFGEFYTWFKQSKLYENTVIILTADHCAYPSNDRAKILGEKSIYPGIFINTIPFIVNYKGIKPLEIDVGGKNSIDFAPTLLHLMRINDGKNYFLGCSLFETCTKKFEYYEAIGSSFYSTEANVLKSVKENDVYPQLISEFYNLSDATLEQ